MSESFRFPDERASKGDTFRCRKCRVYLFSFENLSPFHKKIEQVDQCSAWYINCDDIDADTAIDTLVWMKEAVDRSQWTEGKLYCPKCLSRIGSFNFTQGVHCSCFAFIIPAIWIQKCKVDHISTSDSKPNIRVPENPDNNTDQGNGQGGSPMYYMQTSTTSSQTGLTCFDSGPSGSQTSQSGSQTSKDLELVEQETIVQCKIVCSHITPEALDTGSPVGSKQLRLRKSHEKSGQNFQNISNSDVRISKTDPRDLSDSKTREQSSQISSINVHKESLGSFRIDRRRINREKEMGLALTERQHSESCSTNEHIELPTHGLGKFKADNSRFELLEELDQGQDLKETLQNTAAAGMKKEGSQEKDSQESEEITEQFTCPVCLDLLYEPLVCPCSHVFCDSCMRILNSKSRHSVPRCPLCRKSINYVYSAVDLRDEIKKSYPKAYRVRHKVERRAPHRRLPLPNGRMKARQKRSNRFPDVPMPFSVLVVLGCVLACCGSCLFILFVFCPPTRNQCITIMGYEWMNGY